MDIHYVDASGEVKVKTATAEEASLPTAEELQTLENDVIKDMKAFKRKVFQEEADPLFFKAQRGEATMQEWLDKVAEIDSLYPTTP